MLSEFCVSITTTLIRVKLLPFIEAVVNAAELCPKYSALVHAIIDPVTRQVKTAIAFGHTLSIPEGVVLISDTCDSPDGKNRAVYIQ